MLFDDVSAEECANLEYIVLDKYIQVEVFVKYLTKSSSSIWGAYCQLKQLRLKQPYRSDRILIVETGSTTH